MFPKLNRYKNIYLDYAATTPVDSLVVKAMAPYWSKSFGNPSSLHKQGREARVAVETSRKSVADVIEAKSSEIIFTAGGTESCNLAIFGIARMNTDFKTDEHRLAPHIITSAIEHHAVLKPIEALKGEGYKVTVLDVNEDGLINIKDLQKVIRPETILVSIMYANNEIGTVEPIAEIGKLLARNNAERLKRGMTRILFHTDACQAAGSLDINVHRLGVDLMSVNGSKIYGPKQTGFLFVKSGIQPVRSQTQNVSAGAQSRQTSNGLSLKPLIYGGGQEKDLRSGTENVPGIVGLAKALEIVQKVGGSESRRVGKLQQYFISKLLMIPGVRLNGPNPCHCEEAKALSGRRGNLLNSTSKIASGALAMTDNSRLINNINISIKGVEGEALMLYLDSYRIAVSTGSACTTGQTESSHVLLAIGRSEKEAKSSIRLSLGKYTKKADIDYVLEVLPGIVEQIRKIKDLR